MLHAGDGFQQFLLAASGDTGDTEDLAAVSGKGNVVQLLNAFLVLHGQMFHAKTLVADFGSRALDVQTHGTADHHIGQRLLGGFTGGNISDILALT